MRMFGSGRASGGKAFTGCPPAPLCPTELRQLEPILGAPERPAGWRPAHALTSAFLLLLSACGSNPPAISGDTSCERFRHISATPAQIKVFADNWEVMEPYADQIVSHNVTYDGHCLGVAP
jgi:hypothetical protein